jgi:hypothetical protein
VRRVLLFAGVAFCLLWLVAAFEQAIYHLVHSERVERIAARLGIEW